MLSRTTIRVYCLVLKVTICLLPLGCDDGDNNSDAFYIGGTVLGLNPDEVVSLDNNGEELDVMENDSFTFNTPLADGSKYHVTVIGQPTGQECSVSRGTGTIDGADVTDVEASCIEPLAINEFYVSDRSVGTGDKVTIIWETQGATSCELSPGGIEATPTDYSKIELTLMETTTFILTCQNGDETVSSNPITVEVAEFEWADVATGAYHTCALKTDGRLFCWGRGKYGVLGTDSTANSLVPVQESTAANDWKQASLGLQHSCALKTDGRLFCWGSGEYGVLGTGSTANSLVPVQESTAANDWKQISANSLSTCALKTDGRIFCWGHSEYGQLGNNSTTDILAPMQESSAASDWAHVSSSGSHTCALKTDGRVFCWGDNDNGQLGNDSTVNSSVPVQESTAANDWKQIAAGTDITCALKMDGQLWCWGSGILVEARFYSLVPEQEPTRATDWSQVSLGVQYACALKTNGTLYCWGWGGNGRLGIGSTEDTKVPTQEITGASDWALVSTRQCTCGLKSFGRIACWGHNEYGQVGNNDTTDVLAPVYIQDL